MNIVCTTIAFSIYTIPWVRFYLLFMLDTDWYGWFTQKCLNYWKYTMNNQTTRSENNKEHLTVVSLCFRSSVLCTSASLQCQNSSKGCQRAKWNDLTSSRPASTAVLKSIRMYCPGAKLIDNGTIVSVNCDTQGCYHEWTHSQSINCSWNLQRFLPNMIFCLPLRTTGVLKMVLFCRIFYRGALWKIL